MCMCAYNTHTPRLNYRANRRRAPRYQTAAAAYGTLLAARRKIDISIYQSPSFKWAPGVFCTSFYNHACRLRLEKLLYRGFLEVPADMTVSLLKLPHGGFRSETAVI
jgi:hypothetical protein